MKFNLQKINYAVIPKTFLKDKALSLKAKGLLTVMFTLPEEWNYSIKGLCTLCNCGETQIKNTLNELNFMGYIKVEKQRNEEGKYQYTYNIFYEKQKVNWLDL